MHDDLLDAQASIDWAKTQIPAMQQRLIDWSRADPYEITEEDDPQTGEILVVLVRRGRAAWKIKPSCSERSAVNLRPLFLALKPAPFDGRWRRRATHTFPTR